MAGTEESIALPTGGQPPIVTFKKRNAKAKGSIRERPTTVQAPSQSDDSSSSGDDSSHIVKRRKKNSSAITASTSKDKSSEKDLYATVFTANRNASITSTNDATKSVNWFDEDPKVTPARTVGPVKASSNVRTITVTDFAPDVCKNWKQLGFCGFG
jgi:RING finger protein 113A